MAERSGCLLWSGGLDTASSSTVPKTVLKLETDWLGGRVRGLLAHLH